MTAVKLPTRASIRLAGKVPSAAKQTPYGSTSPKASPNTGRGRKAANFTKSKVDKSDFTTKSKSVGPSSRSSSNRSSCRQHQARLQKRLTEIEDIFTNEQAHSKNLRSERRMIWVSMEKLEKRIEDGQKTIFKLVDNERLRGAEVDSTERLEKELAMLYDKHYAVGGELDESAGKILDAMKEQLDVKILMGESMVMKL
ncbi:hypothetical protein ACHAQK_009884 [Fusarium lateritium]